MALEFSRMFSPDPIVFNCMDELSSFKNALESLKTLKKGLLKIAGLAKRQITIVSPFLKPEIQH